MDKQKRKRGSKLELGIKLLKICHFVRLFAIIADHYLILAMSIVRRIGRWKILWDNEDHDAFVQKGVSDGERSEPVGGHPIRNPSLIFPPNGHVSPSNEKGRLPISSGMRPLAFRKSRVLNFSLFFRQNHVW